MTRTHLPVLLTTIVDERTVNGKRVPSNGVVPPPRDGVRKDGVRKEKTAPAVEPAKTPTKTPTRTLEPRTRPGD